MRLIVQIGQGNGNPEKGDGSGRRETLGMHLANRPKNSARDLANGDLRLGQENAGTAK